MSVVPAWGLRAGSADEVAVRGRALDPITPDRAWGGSTGRGVRVCIVDSGVEPDHPMVGPVQASYAVVRTDDGLRVEPTPAADLCGHGTACAGIVRAIASDCELHSLRVLGEQFSGTGDILLFGLQWAVQQRYDIVNLSLSTTRRAFLDDLHTLVDQAFFQGTLIVASAHNSPVESYPWCFSSVISVGSHDRDDPDLLFYNPHPPVEFFAHGQNVTVAWSGGSSRSTTGNSFATPRVSGYVARVLAKHPGLTPFQVKSVLYQAAANVVTEPILPQPESRGAR